MLSNINQTQKHQLHWFWTVILLSLRTSRKCFDEEECFRNRIKRLACATSVESFKGKRVCLPARDLEVCVKTVQQGRPVYERTGTELVHERCPRKRRKSIVTNSSQNVSHLTQLHQCAKQIQNWAVSHFHASMPIANWKLHQLQGISTWGFVLISVDLVTARKTLTINCLI